MKLSAIIIATISLFALASCGGIENKTREESRLPIEQEIGKPAENSCPHSDCANHDCCPGDKPCSTPVDSIQQ